MLAGSQRDALWSYSYTIPELHTHLSLLNKSLFIMSLFNAHIEYLSQCIVCFCQSTILFQGLRVGGFWYGQRLEESSQYGLLDCTSRPITYMSFVQQPDKYQLLVSLNLDFAGIVGHR